MPVLYERYYILFDLTGIIIKKIKWFYRKKIKLSQMIIFRPLLEVLKATRYASAIFTVNR